MAGRRGTEGEEILGAGDEEGRWCRAEKIGLESELMFLVLRWFVTLKK